MKDMKAMARPFLALYAMALVIALLGRIGLAVAGDTGVLAFDYISASGVPVLDVICSILTGSAFVAFLFAAGLALCVSTAGAVLYGALASRAEGDAGAPAVRPRPGLPIIVVGVIGFAAFLGTLLGAASMVVCACVARWRAGYSLELSLIAAVALCGAVVAALTVGTFSALNVASISLPALSGWFAADVVANVAMLFGAKVYADKMSLAS